MEKIRQHTREGFSLVELMIYTTVFSLVVLGTLQLMSTFQVSSSRISNLAGSSLEVDSTVLRLNSLLTDSTDVDICNVYKTDTSLTDSQELSCGLDDGNLRDAGCLIMRGNRLSERWGVEFDGDDHMAIDFRSTIAGGSDLTISMWLKDVTCNDSDGCLLAQLGQIDENQWWPNSSGNNDRIALIALNDSGNLQLRLATQNRSNEAGSNRSIVYPSITRTVRTLEDWNSGTWTHIVLTVEHDSDIDLDFGTTGSGSDINDLSFDLYVNGAEVEPTNTETAMDLDIVINQLLLFGSYRTRSHFSGLVGPIQIFDEKISDDLIRRLSNEFYVSTVGDFNLSMKLEDYGSTNIFTRSASDFEFLDFNGYEAICSTETELPADTIRICRSFTDAESFEEMYESAVWEGTAGEAFMFAKDPSSTLDWDNRPYALYSNIDADDFCLSATDPGQTTDPEDSGWTKLTDFKYFPGQDADGNTRFFSQLENSDLYQLLISSELKSGGGQGLAAVGSLNITRTLEDDALCQIAPDNINFGIPSESESTCDLRYATVLIQDDFQPNIDLLYVMPDSDDDGDGDYVTNWSPSDGSAPNCSASVTWGTNETVNICRKTVAAPDGTNYLRYTFRDIPLMGDDGRAVYDAESGTLQFDAGSGNTLEGEEWFQIMKQVRYTYQDLVNETAAYEKNRTILFSLGDSLPFYPPDDSNTPHYYRFITDANGDSTPDIDWPDARQDAIADSAKFCGLQGYLATITSEEENDFIFTRLSQDDGTIAAGWLGGTSHEDWQKDWDDPTLDFTDSPNNPGTYRWIDGPEHGSIFYKYSYDDTGSGGTHEDRRKRTGRYVRKDPAGQQCLASGESSEASTSQTDLDRFVVGFDPLPGNSTNKCRPRPGPLCEGLDLWFHNFQVRIDDDGDCVTTSGSSTDPVMREPNDSQSGGTREYFLQITGNTEGYGTWNDLRWNYDKNSNTQHKIKGYYVEYGGCTGSCVKDASDPSGLAITAREEIDVSAIRRICERPN